MSTKYEVNLNSSNHSTQSLTRQIHGGLRRLISQCKGDRETFIVGLKNTKSLASIPLDTHHIKELDVHQSLQVVKKQKVILNGVKLSNMHFLYGIEKLVGTFGEVYGVQSAPRHILDLLILHMDRSTLTSDCFRKLNSDVVDKNGKTSAYRKIRPRYPDFLFAPINQESVLEDPTIVDLYMEHGCVHATISSTIPFGLFLGTHLREMRPLWEKIISMQEDVDSLVDKCISRKDAFDEHNPWISLKVVVRERININNGESVRLFSLHPVI